MKSNHINLDEVIARGAVVIDVRTVEEYEAGHLEGSLNIPLDKIDEAAGRLSKNVPIITCCRSGNRSEVAKNILKAAGYKEVYNGGSCDNLGIAQGASH